MASRSSRRLREQRAEKLVTACAAGDGDKVEQMLLDHTVVVRRETMQTMVETLVKQCDWTLLARLLLLDTPDGVMFLSVMDVLTEEKIVRTLLPELKKDLPGLCHKTVLKKAVKRMLASVPLVPADMRSVAIRLAVCVMGKLSGGKPSDYSFDLQKTWDFWEDIKACTEVWDREHTLPAPQVNTGVIHPEVMRLCLLRCMVEDGSKVCTDVAVVMAVEMEQWQCLVSLMHTYPSLALPYIVHKMCRRHVWNCAALLLKAILCGHIPSAVERLYKQETFTEGPALDEFVGTCTQLGLNGAGALAAFCAGDFRRTRRLFLLETSSKLCSVLITEILALTNVWMFPMHWELAVELVVSKPNMASVLVDPCIMNVHLRVAKVALKMLFTQRNADCFAGEKLESYFLEILQESHSRLFQNMVTQDVFDLSIVGTEFGTMMHSIAAKLAEEQEGCEEAQRRLRAMLRTCIEAGLSTQPTDTQHVRYRQKRPRPMESLRQVVSHAALDILQLLYKTGAVSNAELYTLREEAENVRIESGPQSHYAEEEKAVCDYLNTVACTPRSLEDLSRLAVSRYIGCRADRKHRALSLGLPMQLVRKVLFHDVLYSV